MLSKHFFLIPYIFIALVLAGCSTNPATGENQFTALMSPQQEIQVGAQEHQKIIKQTPLYPDQNLQNYVQQIGNRVVKPTELSDVQYKFFLLDTPMVNAFALPGGYIYVTRGLMALSNSEAELAAVMAHESGHITGRHSAERYSRGVLTSLGASIISAAVGEAGVSQALGLGSDLYIKSYSRGQESQADALGIRYLSKSGYDPRAMAAFLTSLEADTALDAKLAGKAQSGATDYFSTHPATAERVAQAKAEAGQYPSQGEVNRDGYLRALEGLVYGDSDDQGFVRGQNFYHPEMGFTFAAPEGYQMQNQPDQVVAIGRNGGVIVFDMAANKQNLSPLDFMSQLWVKGQTVQSAENITIHGMPAATGTFDGAINGKPMTIRLVAINWAQGKIARFLMGIPSNLSRADIEDLQRTTYSFRRLSPAEKSGLHAHKIKIVQARAGDTMASLSANFPYPDYREERFMVLNGLRRTDKIVPGAIYKTVVE